MGLDAIILVLLSVSMHATWNFLSKKSTSSAAFFCISSFMAALCWVWVLPVFGFPVESLGAKGLSLWGISLFFETLYFVGLFNAYSKTDMSLAYPVARALPVLLIAAVTPILYPGRYPSAWGVAGLLIVCCGCLLMPLKKFSDFSLKNYFNMAMWFIILAAIGTTGYTINDAELVKICASGQGYDDMKAAYLLSFVINFGLGCIMGVIVLFRKQEQENFKLLVSSFKNFCYPAIAGILSSLAYALVLMAMQRVEHLSFLQAFRQMSLPIGLLLGIFILKEPAHRPKLTGITLIVTGLVLIAFLGK
ncbi:MAG: hypothetical protein IKC89_07485 [Lentisphaeria bacterium]|nr:hypothetical protein [Lentisphaeria bacterium]